MLSIMRCTTLDFAVVTPFCTCFSSDISWGTVALFTSCLTALVLPRLGLLSGLKSTAKIAHAMRDAREGHSVTYLQLKEVPAGIHVRHAEGRPRRDRDWQIPKAALRTESTSDRPSNRLGELSRLARCSKVHSTSKCAK